MGGYDLVEVATIFTTVYVVQCIYTLGTVHTVVRQMGNINGVFLLSAKKFGYYGHIFCWTV